MLALSGSSVVEAEPVQYGLLNTPTDLNCSTVLDEFMFLVEISWFRGEGANRTRLSGRPWFERTVISNEGVYTCIVNIQEMGVVIEKIINFQVVGKHNTIIGLFIIVRHRGQGIYSI